MATKKEDATVKRKPTRKGNLALKIVKGLERPKCPYATTRKLAKSSSAPTQPSTNRASRPGRISPVTSFGTTAGRPRPDSVFEWFIKQH